jgi:hypothetical protein
MNLGYVIEFWVHLIRTTNKSQGAFMKMRLALLAVLMLSASAFGGPITSVTYATASSQGYPVFLFVNGPPAPNNPLPGQSGGYTDVRFNVGGSFSIGDKECYGVVANGCTAGYIPSNSATASASVNNGSDQEQYQGTTQNSPGGLNGTGSISVSRSSGSATQSGYVSDGFSDTAFYTVAATGAHPAGTTGTALLTYTLPSPTFFNNSAGSPSTQVWFGAFDFSSFIPTGVTATDQYQVSAIDLTTLSGLTQEQFTVPFVFGSSFAVRLGENLGIGWVANTAGATSVNFSFDPMISLTGIQLSAGGNQLPSFSMSDDLGNQFGSSGLIAPEPSSYILDGTGLLMLAFAAARQSLKRR